MTAAHGRERPRRIAEFEILQEIGSGGMGVVYRALDTKLGREVALKTLRSNDDHRLIERFGEEARALGPLEHPLIVLPYQCGTADGVVFLAMKYVPGSRDLQSVINSRTRLSMRRKLWIITQILRALDYVHSKGTIHRDIKPSNVMLLPDGSINLIDFGLARAVESVRPMSRGSGTPFYMAPEQQFGPRVDHRADLFAAGAVAYELLTNRRPFNVCEATPPKPAPLGIDWSTRFPQLEAIIFKALEPSPDDRFQSAAEMRIAFEELSANPAFAAAVDDETILIDEPKPPHPPLPLRTEGHTAGAVVTPPLRKVSRVRKLAVAGTLVLVVLLVVGVAFRFAQRTPSDAASSRSQSPTSATDAPPAQEVPETQVDSAPNPKLVDRDRDAGLPPGIRAPSHSPLLVPPTASQAAAVECELGDAAGYINAIALTPDAQYVVAATADGKLRVWGTNCDALQRSLPALWAESGVAQAVAINSTGTRLAAAWTQDRLVRVWDLKSGGGNPPQFTSEPTVLDGHPGPVTALAFGNSDQLFSASDRVLQEYRFTESQVARRPFALGAFMGLITSIEADGEPGLLAAASSGGSLATWSQGSVMPSHLFSLCRNVRTVSVARRGLIAGGCSDGKLVVCKPDRPCEPLSSQGDEAIAVAGAGGTALTALTFDAMGKWLASGDAKGIVTIRDLASGAAIQGSDAHRGARITALKFSAVGRKLVSGDGEGAIRMWDLSRTMPEDGPRYDGDNSRAPSETRTDPRSGAAPTTHANSPAGSARQDSSDRTSGKTPAAQYTSAADGALTSDKWSVERNGRPTGMPNLTFQPGGYIDGYKVRGRWIAEGNRLTVTSFDTRQMVPHPTPMEFQLQRDGTFLSATGIRLRKVY